jgi:hypothetical protein
MERTYRWISDAMQTRDRDPAQVRVGAGNG